MSEEGCCSPLLLLERGSLGTVKTEGGNMHVNSTCLCTSKNSSAVGKDLTGDSFCKMI